MGVIMARNFKTFYFHPSHPAPLPLGEREFADEHYLDSFSLQAHPWDEYFVERIRYR